MANEHHIERVHNDPKGYGDGLSDFYRCSCGRTFSEVQYGGAEEAFAHLEEAPVGGVVLVETNGSDPEVTTQLRGNAVEIVAIDWDEVERGDNRQYIRDILDRIVELGIADIKAPNHVGMPEVVEQLLQALAEK